MALQHILPKTIRIFDDPQININQTPKELIEQHLPCSSKNGAPTGFEPVLSRIKCGMSWTGLNIE